MGFQWCRFHVAAFGVFFLLSLCFSSPSRRVLGAHSAASRCAQSVASWGAGAREEIAMQVLPVPYKGRQCRVLLGMSQLWRAASGGVIDFREFSQSTVHGPWIFV